MIAADLSTKAARRVGIRGRLVLVALAAALPMLILALAIVAQLADSKRQVKNEALLYAGRLLLESVDKEISRYVYAARMLAASPALLNSDLSGFRSEADRALRGLPRAAIQLVDEDGTLLLDTAVAAGQPLPPPSPDLIANGRRALATGAPQIGYLGRAPDSAFFVGITMPVMRDAAGVRQLIVAIDPRVFRALLDGQHLPDGWEAAVASPSGLLITRSLPGEWTGRAISASWRGQLGRDGLHEFLTPEGAVKVSSTYASQLTGWTVAVGQPKEVFEAPITRTYQLALLAGMVVIVVSSALAAKIAQTVTAPIRSLAASAAALECGERITVPRSSVPEFDRALRAFDQASRLVIAHQRALHDSDERIRVAQEAAHAGIWEWRVADGRNIWTDPLFTLYGLRPGTRQPSFQTWASVIHPDDREQVVGTVWRAMQTRQEFEIEWRVDLPWSREERWLLSRGRPLFGAGGEVERYVGIVVDVTERKRMEKAVRTSELRLQQASRLSEIGRMAAALAHEVNQPLAAVTNYMAGGRRMLETSLPESVRLHKLKEVLEKASVQALRAGEVIRRLREFIGVGDSEKTVENARRILQDASVLATIAATHDGVAVRSNFTDSGEVLVDKVQVQQVVLNLVRNAIEAMATANAKELTLSLWQGEDVVAFSVGDTGPGIAPEMRDRLFSPFASTKTNGMGIGLSVCREIVEAHGGKIWADHKPEGGMQFSFTLPLLRGTHDFSQKSVA